MIHFDIIKDKDFEVYNKLNLFYNSKLIYKGDGLDIVTSVNNVLELRLNNLIPDRIVNFKGILIQDMIIWIPTDNSQISSFEVIYMSVMEFNELWNALKFPIEADFKLLSNYHMEDIKYIWLYNSMYLGSFDSFSNLKSEISKNVLAFSSDEFSIINFQNIIEKNWDDNFLDIKLIHINLQLNYEKIIVYIDSPKGIYEWNAIYFDPISKAFFLNICQNFLASFYWIV